MAEPRKRRTREHVLADIGSKYAAYLAALAGCITTPPSEGGDYGYDLYLETFDASGFIENEVVRLQVKASEAFE